MRFFWVIQKLLTRPRFQSHTVFIPKEGLNKHKGENNDTCAESARQLFYMPPCNAKEERIRTRALTTPHENGIQVDILKYAAEYTPPSLYITMLAAIQLKKNDLCLVPLR